MGWGKLPGRLSDWEADSCSRQPGRSLRLGPAQTFPLLIAEFALPCPPFSKPAFHLLQEPSHRTPLCPSDSPAGWLNTPSPPPPAQLRALAQPHPSGPRLPHSCLKCSLVLSGPTPTGPLPTCPIRSRPVPLCTSHTRLSSVSPGPQDLCTAVPVPPQLFSASFGLANYATLSECLSQKELSSSQHDGSLSHGLRTAAGFFHLKEKELRCNSHNRKVASF